MYTDDVDMILKLAAECGVSEQVTPPMAAFLATLLDRAQHSKKRVSVTYRTGENETTYTATSPRRLLELQHILISGENK